MILIIIFQIKVIVTFTNKKLYIKMLMKNEKETFEHSNELNWDKLVFYIKDSFQKQRLDHNLKVAEVKSNK